MASVSISHSASTRTLRRRSSWLDLRRASLPWVRRVGAVFCAVALVEGSIRLLEYATDLPLDDARSAAACKLTPGAIHAGRSINSAGYWDDDFQTSTAIDSKPRVAVLGGLSTLGGDAQTNFVSQLEHVLPGVDVDHFGLPAAGPREHAAQLARDVLKRKPKRVLICLDATDDFAPRQNEKSGLDCRTLQFVESVFAPSTAHAVDMAGSLTLSPALDYDEYVRRRAASVAAAAKSPHQERDARRREAQAAFERVVRVCNKHDVPVTLVLVPGEFQLSTNLTSAFCRRMQLDPTELELELPQRRWSALAEHLQVSTIDLLPALREKGEIVYRPNSADWNDRGQTIVAETIARDLKNRGI